MSITKEYTNGEVTVVWQPGNCIHSELCFTGLPHVFDPQKRPWVNTDGASTQEIIDQVKKCPSGALSYYMNNKKEDNMEIERENIAEVILNGPLLVYGNLKVKDKNGSETRHNKVTAFCRCAGSFNKPYCDGTHKKIGFEG